MPRFNRHHYSRVTAAIRLPELIMAGQVTAHVTTSCTTSCLSIIQEAALCSAMWSIHSEYIAEGGGPQSHQAKKSGSCQAGSHKQEQHSPSGHF